MIGNDKRTGTRPLALFDTETTGVAPPRQDRLAAIVETTTRPVAALSVLVVAARPGIGSRRRDRDPRHHHRARTWGRNGRRGRGPWIAEHLIALSRNGIPVVGHIHST